MKPIQFVNIFRAIAIASAFLLVICFPKQVNAQVEPQQKTAELIDEEKMLPADSTKINPLDTIKIFPISKHGLPSAMIGNFSDQGISKKDINYDNYYNSSDIISKNIFSYTYDLGFPGLNAFPSFNGGQAKDNQILYNGRLMVSPEYGYFNLNYLSPESFEAITQYVGSKAVVLSGKTTLINFNERKFNSAKPFTKMWYTQSGYGLIGAEGIFSQNFHPKYNFTMSFRNLSGDGRFSNSETEHWNIRSGLRYNPDDYSSLSLSYLFNNHKQGLNGGVDFSSSQGVNEIDAQVIFNDFSERIYRTDLTLTYSNKFDSTNTKSLLANLFVSFEESNKSFAGVMPMIYRDTTARNTYNSDYFGANAMYEVMIFKQTSLNFGADITIINVGKTVLTNSFSTTNYAVFTQMQQRFTSNLSLSSGLRYEHYFNNDLISFGGNLSYLIDSASKFYADFSRSGTVPSIMQGLDKPKEIHYLALVGYDYSMEHSKLSTKLFARRINNPILAEISMDGNYLIYSDDCNCNNRDIIGAEIRFKSMLLEKIHYEIIANGYYSMMNSENDELYPNLIVSGSAYYEYNIGNSIFRGGLEGKINSSFKGLQYYPITNDFLTSNITSSWMGNGLNAFVSLRLGNAFLRLSFENLLAEEYYTTVYYPMTDRLFHLSVSWSFDD